MSSYRLNCYFLCEGVFDCNLLTPITSSGGAGVLLVRVRDVLQVLSTNHRVVRDLVGGNVLDPCVHWLAVLGIWEPSLVSCPTGRARLTPYGHQPHLLRIESAHKAGPAGRCEDVALAGVAARSATEAGDLPASHLDTCRTFLPLSWVVVLAYYRGIGLLTTKRLPDTSLLSSGT